MIRRLGLAATLATALLAAAPASATSPLITDPAGDTGPLTFVRQHFAVPAPSDPTVDIVSGDVQVAGGVLSLSTTVVDLVDAAPDHGDGRRFHFSLYHGGARITADAYVAPGFEQFAMTYYGAQQGSADIPVTGEHDILTDTVTISVDLAVLNAAIDAATAGRDQLVRPGSRLSAAQAQTWYIAVAETLGRSYAVGLDYADITSDEGAVYEVPGE